MQDVLHLKKKKIRTKVGAERVVWGRGRGCVVGVWVSGGGVGAGVWWWCGGGG